ncbi:MAG: hypothetical protein AABY22_01920 [Nanoarchaeota archaeon]
MITIIRNKNEVNIEVSSSINWTFTFKTTCSDEAYATFLEKDISNKLYETLQEIRKKAYNEGWSDKSKKEIKKTWFGGRFKD